MAAIGDNRRRLADLMERRRVELGLRWKEVAEAGGISYEAIRAVRNGDAELRALTKHCIDIGLRWEPGSVMRILEGGEPVSQDDAVAAGSPASRLFIPVPDDGPGGSLHSLMDRILTDRAERVIWTTKTLTEDERLEAIQQLRDKRAELTAELERRAHSHDTGLRAVPL